MRAVLLLLAAGLCLPACSSDSPVAVPDPVGQTAFEEILTAAGRVAPPPAEVHDVQETQGPLDGDYRTITEVHDNSDNIQDITNLGLNDAVIFPGSLVKGDQIYSYVYTPISAPRAPATLSISLGGDAVSEVVNAPGQLSAVRQGVSNLVARALAGNTSAPAQVQWDYQRVYSKSQMGLFVNADIEYGAGSVQSAFDWSTGSEKTRIVAKYTQIYYTVDMDAPANPRAVFSDGISEEQLAGALPEGSQPMYVSTVKYGFMALCAIESNFSEEEMNLAMDASYSGAVDVDLGFGYSARDVMTSSTIKVIVYGGSTGGISELNSFDGFMNIIRSSTTFSEESQGVPLVYVFRHLQDSELAQIALTSQYAITRRIKVRQGVRVTVDRFVCESSTDDECFANDQVDMDWFRVVCNASNSLGAGQPLVQFNPANQVVYNWQSGSYQEMSAGSIHNAGSSIDLVFDDETYDFAASKLSLSGYARDYDACGGNEGEWSSAFDLSGPQMFGKHNFYIYSSDFRFRVEVTVSQI